MFKENVKNDLEQVFLNTNEFADVFTHNGREFKGIWRDKTEIVIDGVVSYAPWVVVDDATASIIMNGDAIERNGDTLYVLERQRVDADLVGLFVSKDDRRTF